MDFTHTMEGWRKGGGGSGGTYRVKKKENSVYFILYFFSLTGKIKFVCVGGSKTVSPQVTQANMRNH